MSHLFDAKSKGGYVVVGLGGSICKLNPMVPLQDSAPYSLKTRLACQHNSIAAFLAILSSH